jgi:hypothetical protein
MAACGRPRETVLRRPWAARHREPWGYRISGRVGAPMAACGRPPDHYQDLRRQGVRFGPSMVKICEINWKNDPEQGPTSPTPNPMDYVQGPKRSQVPPGEPVSGGRSARGKLSGYWHARDTRGPRYQFSRVWEQKISQKCLKVL